MKEIKPGDGVIFMKVGIHAKESLEDIIKRKQDEYAKAGKIFWGYGGNTCHPSKHVQPFARSHEKIGNPVHIVMHEMNSMHFAEPELAKQYSEDGIDWYDVPKGIEVRGSRYGMVIGGLSEEEFDLNLRQTIVAIGPSRGREGQDYIKGRVDKGCFEIQEQPLYPDIPNAKEIKQINLSAPLVAPYAVFLK